MAAHPDCVKGSEFFDLVSIAEKVLECTLYEKKPVIGSRYNYYCAERAHGGPVCLKQCDTCAKMLP